MWKNLPSWLKGGFLFTGFSLLMSIFSFSFSTVSQFHLSSFLGRSLFLIGYPINKILIIIRQSLPFPIDQTPVLLSSFIIISYLISTFIVGGLFAVFYKKSNSWKGAIKGYLVGIVITVILGSIISGFIFDWVSLPIIIISIVTGYIIGRKKLNYSE